MATVYHAGTVVNYSFIDDNGVLKTRCAWLVTDTDGSPSNFADVKYTKYPVDYAAGPGPITQLAKKVPVGVGTANTWALPDSPPYT
jgi:hypothetical protein